MDRLFTIIFGTIALGVLLSVLALHWVVVPSDLEQSRLEELHARTTLFLQQATDPEPKQPLRWAYVYPLQLMHVRSLFELSADQLQRLDELSLRARRLFEITFELTRATLPMLELRVVHSSILNDQRYFDLDEQGGRYYGRYFVGRNIGYVTDAAFDDDAHIVHEFSHFLSDAHDISKNKNEEERRARWFVNFYAEYEQRLEKLPVDENGMDVPTTWKLTRHVGTDVLLRSTRRISREKVKTLTEAVLETQSVFARDYGLTPGLSPPAESMLMLNVVRAGALKNEAIAEAHQGELWLTPAALAQDLRALHHAMFHVWATRSGLSGLFVVEELEAHAMAFHLRVRDYRAAEMAAH